LSNDLDRRLRARAVRWPLSAKAKRSGLQARVTQLFGSTATALRAGGAVGDAALRLGIDFRGIEGASRVGGDGNAALGARVIRMGQQISLP
jgi:hypothetical protein